MNYGRIDDLPAYLSHDELHRVPSWVRAWVEAGAMAAEEAVTWVLSTPSQASCAAAAYMHS